jgi:FixJ family two-component response regulator
MHHIKPWVAVVDDDESVRHALGRLIRAAGFDVETFASGGEFMLAGPRRSPDCVVLDLRMPQVNGFRVQEALRDSGTRLPVIVITGDHSEESRTRALAHGALAYLRKPVDESTLLDAIGTALASTAGDAR